MIKNISLFRDLSDDELNSIIKFTSKKLFPARTTFIQQGDESDVIYFILKGTVSIFKINENGEEINITVLGEGEIVGEMSLADNQPRSAFARTLTDCEFLVISQINFSSLIQVYPSIAIRLIQLFSIRLRQANNHMEELVTENLETRTLNVLRTLSKYFTNGVITLSHEELSSIVGATRARVTKTLDDLKNKNLLTLSHRKIILN